MLLTEADARAKWCPMVRYLAVFKNDEGRRETAGAYNRGVQDSGMGKSQCVGSDCMMWRWSMSTDEAHRKTDHPNRDFSLDHAQHAASVRTGYCGLAGRPGELP